ncbi:MAG: exosome complex RNA-binding protein Csl4 [Thermoplasmata archaeon]|nr:MAG: exosome complex RNA-binding protein Csl4 [Thermoplasmata archaeon]
MENEKKRFMLPGDVIGTSEEYIAGDGTFESDGKIYSSNTGYLEIDADEMVARVNPVTSMPVILKKNDLVYGYVYGIKGSMTIIEVAKVIGKARGISMSDTMGSLHISKIQSDFLKDATQAFKVGDIIRAKVIQVEPSLQLSTQGKNLGVILASCRECNLPLKREGKGLCCPQCESRYSRKLAQDYGNVNE